MRTICVFSGSRADYGPLRPLIDLLHEDQEVDLKLLVSGGHLVPGQGCTVDRIESDGHSVTERIETVLAGDSPTAVAKSFGLGIIGYADALSRIDPDILVVLGDRYEAMAVCTAAALRLLPIAHIAGGEVTHGSTDDFVRHCITKMALLHFTANEEFRRRVIQLGEEPDRVFSVGTPGLDTIRTLGLLSKGQLMARLRMRGGRVLIAATYHPATADPDASELGAAGLLAALEDYPDATVVFTGSNVDQGSSSISDSIRDYVAAHPGSTALRASLGQLTYLSLVKHADVVVGNSSSGIIEAPFLGTPTVNIGTRQSGRPRAESVVDCGESADQISTAIRLALSAGHRAQVRCASSCYGDGHAAERILKVLKETPLVGLRKRFHDLSDPP